MMWARTRRPASGILPRRKTQRGQAMLFTLLFAGATALICLVLYNSGTLANTKTQMQNAADAGAYSGGVLLARDHNFSAYTNRAMVANQVTVAQLVSMKSYTQDASATHQRMRGTAHSIQSNLVPVFKPQWTIAINEPVEALASAYASAAPSVVAMLDRLIRIFENAQQLHHQATAVNLVFSARDVVKRNDPKAAISMLTFQAGYTVYQVNAWRNYTAQHQANGTSAVANRFANVVVNRDSTDEFIRDRGSVLLAGWAISLPTPAACPLAIPIETSYWFTHDGGTLLSNDKKRWLALDATMGAGFVLCDDIIPWGYPLIADGLGGSGGALAGSNGGYGSQTGFGGNPSDAKRYGGALNNPSVIIPARRRYNSGPGSSMDSATGGLQNYYRDVANVSGAGSLPANQTAALNGGQVPFTIEIYRDGSDIRTSSKVLGNAAATVSAPESLKGDKMRALASAHAYFYRSKVDSSAFTKAGWARGDNKAEMANLFNPYWQAELVENPPGAYAASIGYP